MIRTDHTAPSTPTSSGPAAPNPGDDPTVIDWPARQAVALIPFQIIDGRPVRPGPTTGIPRGRHQLWHWGEQACADAFVTAHTSDGSTWLAMVERGDGHGWALPGGHVDDGEPVLNAAIRELDEETGLWWPDEPGAGWQVGDPQLVDDPRGSDEAWMVTTVCSIHLGHYNSRTDLPELVGADDAKDAAWIDASTFRRLEACLRFLAGRSAGQVFPAHRELLKTMLDR